MTKNLRSPQNQLFQKGALSSAWLDLIFEFSTFFLRFLSFSSPPGWFQEASFLMTAAYCMPQALLVLTNNDAFIPAHLSLLVAAEDNIRSRGKAAEGWTGPRSSLLGRCAPANGVLHQP